MSCEIERSIQSNTRRGRVMKTIIIFHILHLMVTCDSNPVPEVQKVITTLPTQWQLPLVSTIWKSPVIAVPYFLQGNQFLPYYLRNISRNFSLGSLGTRFKFMKNSHPVVTCYGNDGRPFDGFPCGDGVCVPVRWVCDGERDCKGGADESHCDECDKGDIHCRKKGVDVCISPRFQCDGRKDCQDGSDEDPELCDSDCDFQCRDGRGCVESDKVCNWRHDCADGSDELNCFGRPPQNECHSEFEFQCYDSLHEDTWSQCIPRAWVCDDHDDCPHGEDESVYTCSRKQNYFEY